MTVLSFPTLSVIKRPRSLQWALASNTQLFTSPLNKAPQTYELPGPLWTASFSFENLPDSDAALLQAFLVQLRGMAGRFYLWNFARETPNGSAGGTPLVNGANQTGTNLITDGWPANSTILKAGDFWGVNGELKMQPTDVASDPGGNATLTAEPPLRASPPDNTAITTTKPTCKMMLTSPLSAWTTSAPNLTTIQIDCQEAVK